ncbi:hypothetical protein JVT61DRAFT_1725 [Boletus reticuloceps]|uniref:GPI anchored protein n=1 Tax=Boletus reticuloceps TaxID=495285 RepID=A0A8I3A6C1_9AGAM|nr:hypothetical protein JVT61DRAFT_7022 [Boletus reticuloceps]KAG6376708.1 hypothetical protein JVT61DRAFT_1725 [Boletus reticuloceps]
MLPFLSGFVVLLSMQWVAGDNIPRIARQHTSAALPRVLSQLLIPSSPKFALSDNGGGCTGGYHVCPNFPNICTLDGSHCCSSVMSCPDNTNCFGFGQCCPQDAQTCGGLACCDASATCCDSGITICCSAGYFCCADSYSGCCPNGTFCIAGSNLCSGDGSGGGGSHTTSPSSPFPSQSSLTQSFSVPTFTPAVVSTLLSIVSDVTSTFFTPSSSSTATASATSTVPGSGGQSGSPHSISMPSIGQAVGLAAVVCIIALRGSVF